MLDHIVKGQICQSRDPDRIETAENSFVVVTDGVCRGIFPSVPERYADLPVTDFGDRLILPGMCDLHVHAPQFSFRGLGMDLELLDWLNRYTFPEEAKYRDAEYADRAYQIFTDALRRSATTRAAVFATVHPEATLLLMDKLEASGLPCFVGKVNMDRNAPDELLEPDAETSIHQTEEWICQTQERYTRTKAILTPRFIPSCSDALLAGLKRLQTKYRLPVQSHLSENLDEIAWVRTLHPDTESYAAAYDKFGLFGGDHKCIMAHCVHSGERDLELIKRNGVFIAHSPESNMNLCSGVAPVSRFLALGLRVGLATDMAAGSHESMLRAVTHAIQASKLRWRLSDDSVKPLSFAQGFYLATVGSGEFFGKVGRFDEGFEFDAVVIDDSTLLHPQTLTLRDRLERIVYLADERHITAKYAAGKRLF